ncbi:DUF6908 domain-containing protein [Dyella telluris]|uniref:DUF6908 domain-containing protein n=1 Tax=Dyella telluris TaxID=2763498 RepID=A0A7G8Q4I8_9GAMM|nr:hypothetical protein [Dyella telluris]QNK01696.1 hypothetical protein H8F01_00505 [Dyella telluris]
MTDHKVITAIEQLATQDRTFGRMTWAYEQFDLLMEGHRRNTRFKSQGMMDVLVEVISNHYGQPTYSIASYGESNGDLMRDPDIVLMELTINGTKVLFPLSFRNDWMGIHQETTDEDQGTLDLRLVHSILDFITETWFVQIHDQYKVAPFRETD